MKSNSKDHYALLSSKINEYKNLVNDLTAAEISIAKKLGKSPLFVYITDEGVDRENTEDSGYTDVNDPEYWDMMIGQCKNAAGFRAQELGFDINEIVGRVIY